MECIKSVEELRWEEGLFAVFDLKNEFPSKWYSANQPAAGATERILKIEKLYEYSLQIKIGDTKTAIDKMWLLERYVLT